MGCRPPMSAAPGAGGCGRCCSPATRSRRRFRRAHRQPAAAGDGRADPQPRPAAGEPLPAAAIDWATRADRDRFARRRSPIRGSIRRSTGCSPRSRPRRRRAAGARRWFATNCCCSPSSASASTSTAARCPARNDDLVAVSPRSGRAVSAGRGRALCRQAAAPAALRSRWGHRDLGRYRSTGSP